MLTSLQVQNYALIRNLEIDLKPGFSIITGETGAGKSILLGALSLLLGQRADTNVLLDKKSKCFVEGTFDIKRYNLKSFFSENDIDYDDRTIIRREILPGGKSRAFINDTPVNLNQLREFGIKVVDIHSQHENLNLGNNLFQLLVIDTIAGNRTLVNEFEKLFSEYTGKLRLLEQLKEQAGQAKTDLDYFSFQFQQLEEAKLQNGELEILEEEANTLSHAEEIKFNLLKSADLIGGDETTVLSLIRDALSTFDRITEVYPAARDLRDRLESVYIELKDIASETGIHGERIEINPGRLQAVQERLDLLYNLIQKHAVNTIEGLIILRNELDQNISRITSYDEEIGKAEKEIEALNDHLQKLAENLSERRKAAIPDIEKRIVTMLQQLGIPNARFTVSLSATGYYTPNGVDRVEFLFSANKQAPMLEISKVASGGELSRLMLCVKSLISSSLELPTIIFDEVDAGVSGDIAEKVGNIMKSMSEGKQIINITHLPQVAAKGKFHYLVYKYDRGGATITDIKLLNSEERVMELAKMLSGEELTEAAISNARELLN